MQQLGQANIEIKRCKSDNSPNSTFENIVSVQSFGWWDCPSEAVSLPSTTFSGSRIFKYVC